MTCQKCCNIKRGVILADILVALSLAALLVVSVTQLSGSARDIYDSSTEKDRLMDVYETYIGKFIGLHPYQFKSMTLKEGDSYYQPLATTTISAYARWYGNDRVETDIVVSARNSSVTFTSIDLDPSSSIADAIGTPLCLVDLTNIQHVGSYGYLNKHYIEPSKLDVRIVPILLPIDPTILLTDMIVRNGIAYVSTDSSRQSDPDIFILDIHDLSNSLLLTGLNTGPGISSITLAGNRIFAAVTSRVAQLQSLFLSDLSSISIESSYKLPLPYASATPPLASSIFFDNNRVYVGTEKWDGDEFSIVDIVNPAQPVKIGGVEIGSKVNSILVRNNIAYVANSSEEQLQVVDIHDSSQPRILRGFGPSGWQRQEGETLSAFEDYIDFGRTSGGFNIKTDYEVFDWGTSTPPSTGAYPNHSLDIVGGIYGIIRDRSYLYFISKQSGAEILIFDHLLSTSTSKSVSLPTTPRALTCDGSSLYVLASNSPVIYKISFK